MLTVQKLSETMCYHENYTTSYTIWFISYNKGMIFKKNYLAVSKLSTRKDSDNTFDSKTIASLSLI